MTYPANVGVQVTMDFVQVRVLNSPTGHFYHPVHYRDPPPISLDNILKINPIHPSNINNQIFTTSRVQLCNLGDGTVNVSA